MPAPAAHQVDHHVRHREITGGWLRPAVFGVVDGLVSNFALVAGIAGASAANRVVLLAGLAGLFAGAFSMATGEYNSVRAQQELAHAELALERRELERAPEAEEAELAGIYRGKGLSAALAKQVAREISRDPEQALRVHAREELSIDPDNLASPWTASWASFVSFALGAFVPVLPYVFEVADRALLVSGLISGVALFGVGAFVSRFTNRSAFYTGLRHLGLGGLAALVTHLIGRAVGTGV